MPLIVEWYYSGVHDAMPVMTTTKDDTILQLGRLNTTIEVPPASTPANLPKFLQPPPASPEYELMPEPDPLLVYEPLPQYEYMSLSLPPLEPIVLKVSVIEISSSDFPILAQILLSQIPVNRHQLLPAEFPAMLLDVDVLLGPAGYTP